MNAKIETATTEFIDAAGIRFGYRRIGAAKGTPLILLQHFTGTMDAWDPAVVNAMATDRTVVAFDNAGVGRSSGATPDSVEQMAADAFAFITALGFSSVDLLGFSLGGMVAQALAAKHAGLVRKVLLVGTAPRGGEEHLMQVVQEAQTHTEAPDIRLPLFFTPSKQSQAAGLKFLERTRSRTQDREPDSGPNVMNPQAKALITWCATPDAENAILTAIHQPALVLSGSNDTMLPAANAYHMFKHLENGQLILYPDSGHGALFQYPERFVKHATQFLSE